MNTTKWQLQAEPIVFVVDDDPAVRESLQEMIEEMKVPVECFADAQDFLEGYRSDPRPGCMILDVRMPGMDGLELQQKMKAEDYALPVIIVTAYGDVAMSVTAMQSGALDFLEKPYQSEELRERVREGLVKGLELWNHRLNRQGIQERVNRLTPREREVLELLCRGRETKQIARDLEISPSTVEKHRLKVFEKMQVDSVPRLIRQMVSMNNPAIRWGRLFDKGNV